MKSIHILAMAILSLLLLVGCGGTPVTRQPVAGSKHIASFGLVDVYVFEYKGQEYIIADGYECVAITPVTPSNK